MLEIGAAPRKPSSSNPSGNCAVVSRDAQGNVHLSNDSQPDAGELVFTPAEWTAFTLGIVDGEFDLAPEPVPAEEPSAEEAEEPAQA